jgi:bacterial microcompartment shell protein
MSNQPAITLLEFESVAVGTRVADAMVKRAPVDTFRIGTVHPGKFLILVGGSVAAVEEAHTEAMRLCGDALTDEILLPDVHEDVYASVVGQKRRANKGDALGIIETATIPMNVRAADKIVKEASVTIVEIRLGDGLGGWGITHFCGKLEDVEAAMEAGLASTAHACIATRSTIIPMQHDTLRKSIAGATEFFR